MKKGPLVGPSHTVSTSLGGEELFAIGFSGTTPNAVRLSDVERIFNATALNWANLTDRLCSDFTPLTLILAFKSAGGEE